MFIEIGVIGFATRLSFAGPLLRPTRGAIRPIAVLAPVTVATGTAPLSVAVVRFPLAMLPVAFRPAALLLAAFVRRRTTVAVRTPLPAVTGVLAGKASVPVTLGPLPGCRILRPRPSVFHKCLIGRLSLLRTIRIFPMRTAIPVSEIFHYLSINTIQATNVTHFSYFYVSLSDLFTIKRL